MNLKVDISEYLRKAKLNKKRKRRLSLILAILSFLVFGFMFWQLRQTGTAIEAKDTVDPGGTKTTEAGYTGSSGGENDPGLPVIQTENTEESGKASEASTEEMTPGGDGSKTSEQSTETVGSGENGSDDAGSEKIGSGETGNVPDETLQTSTEETDQASAKETDDGSKEGIIEGTQEGSTEEDASKEAEGISAEDQDGAESATEGSTEQAEEPETTKDKAPVEMTVRFKAETKSGIQVNVLAEEGAFPEGTTMEAEDVDREDAVKLALDGLEQGTGVVDAVAVDITFHDTEGTELEPVADKKVEVSIILPKKQTLEGDEQVLLHQKDDGTVEEVETKEISETEAHFEAESFSLYIMTSTGMKEINEATRIRMKKDQDNSDTNRYVVYVGEDLEFLADDVQPGWNITISNNQNTAGKDKLHRLSGGAITQTETGYEFTKSYKAVREGDCEAVLSNGTESITFYITVVNKMYLTTTMGNLPNNAESYAKLYGWGNPAQGAPYRRYVDEEIEFSIYVDESDTGNYGVVNANGHTLEAVANSNKTETDLGDEFPADIKKVSITYKLTEAGDPDAQGARVWFGPNQSDTEDALFMKVQGALYVRTSLGLKNIDYVDEWLGGIGLPNTNGYVANSIHFPYVMYVGDEVEFVGYDETARFDHQSIVVSTYTESGSTRHEKLGNSDVDFVEVLSNTPTDPVTHMTSIHLKANAEGFVEVPFGDKRTIYVEILSERGCNHADIEISDGGKYSFTVVRFDEATHTKTTTVKVYESYITDVNGCYLYKSNGDLIIPTHATSTDCSYSTADYYKNGNPGETQYELTSQYRMEGDTRIFSDKWYNRSDVDHALFDVALMLKPSYYFTITEPEGGTATESEKFQLTGAPEIIQSTLFHMNHQDVIDATNKCPNHSGMDFTITADLAMTELKAEKQLIGRDLTGGDYLFEILDESGKRVATAQNDANGEILFDNLYFEHETTPGNPYRYTLREVVPEDPGDILYDTTEYTLLIDVDKREVYGQSVMVAEISVEGDEYTIFENKVKYKLPETGGSGVHMYWLLGAGIMISSVALYRRKRKNE